MGDRLVKVIAHRGASSSAPENTLAAFRRAKADGADGIEFDVQRTSDDELVVIHDALLDRTTTGSGPVFQTTLNEIASLDAGGWFGPQFTGERVPKLDEVLGLTDIDFELEFKGWGRGLLDGVLAAVDRIGVCDRVKFTGWNLPLLCVLRSERPTARIGLFSQRPQPWMTDAVFEEYVVGTAETSPADVAHVYAAAVTKRIVDRLHRLGLEVHANDAADVEEMRWAIEAGVDSLSTDDVNAALAVRQTHG